MSALIGITEERLTEIIAVATQKGYEQALSDIEQKEWLNSRTEICQFLSPNKPISPATFNRNRQKGMYGDSIIGNGIRCKARKCELMSAIQRYQLSLL